MKSSVGYSVSLWLWLSPICLFAQDIVINELQNRNYRTVTDNDGEYSDWMEVKNNSFESINLAGYGLTDDQSEPFKWIFPDTLLEPQAILLVWLSGNNRDVPGLPLHANFSLSNDEALAITNSDMSEFDVVPPQLLPKDVSFGIALDQSEAYFAMPTPGEPNDTEAYSGICSPPVLSHSSGFYEEPFSLTITSSEEDDIIYSTDGSEPLSDHITEPHTYQYKNSYAFLPSQSPGPFLTDTLKSFNYDGAIEIIDRSNEPDRLSQKSSTNEFVPGYFPDEPSFKGTVIRARSTAPGKIPSEIVTAVYFVSPEGWNRYNLPVVSITLDERDLFQYNIGMHTAGQTFDIWRAQNPDASPPPINQANYGRQGFNWERPGHVDFFDMSEESLVLSGELGVRIHGASSRRFPRKSFRLYARSDYNTPELEYPFFEDHFTNVFERIVLRNGGNDERLSNMRDAVIHRMAKPIRAITNASRPYYVFLNGEFYGLNLLREFIDNNYFKIRYGIEGEDLDLIKGVMEIESGDEERYLEVHELCLFEDLTDEASYDQFTNWVEIESYIDVFVVNAIAANPDQLVKNTIWWRDKSDETVDDRFRSVLVDLDKSWGHDLNGEITLPEFDFVSFLMLNTLDFDAPYYDCFLAAMENQEFKNHFINRTADVLNTYFQPWRTTEIIEDMRDQYLPFYQEHIDRWSRNFTVQSVDEWLASVDSMLVFAEEKPMHHRMHINDYFDAGGLYDLTVDASGSEEGYIHLNTIELLSSTEGIPEPVYPWEGIYFKQIPVTFTAIPNEGFVFSHWEGALEGNESEISSTFDSDSVYVKAVFLADTAMTVPSSGFQNLLKAYPNPSEGQFTIVQTSERIHSYSVYNASGQLILKNNDPEESGYESFRIEGSGVFFLEVVYESGQISRAKLIKL